LYGKPKIDNKFLIFLKNRQGPPVISRMKSEDENILS